MKKKFLIGGGITALVAVIVVIAVFAQGGNYFKGSVGEVFDGSRFGGVLEEPIALETSNGPNFYVQADRNNLTCNLSNPIGSKYCPFESIQEAVSRMVTAGLNNSEIYIAEGTYDGANLSGYAIKLKGGYKNGFSGNAWNTIVNSPVTFSDVSGEITGLKFSVKDNANLALQVVNHNETERMEIYNNTFEGGFTQKDMVLINGSNILLRNNSFDDVKSKESIVNALGRVIVKDNYFNKALAGGNQEAIIKTTDGYIYNNLIINSLSGTSNGIYSEEGDSLIANNTIANNPGIIKFALKIVAPGKAYNNLIVNNGGDAIVAGEFADVTKNGIDNSTIKTELLQKGNFLCDADFSSTNSTNKNDYKLGDNTTCKDKGMAVTNVTEDSFGTSRPQGSAYDVGFYEAPYQFVGGLVNPIVVMPLDIAECGDGNVDAGEQCDDGNTSNGDGCDSDCKTEPEEILPDNDVCPNIEGVQTAVPEGFELVDGECSPEDNPSQPEQVACGDWSDISSSDPEYDIWMYLCEKDIVKGNEDGTLRPEDKLNRAELLALAFRASDYENVYDVDEDADYCFPDVTTGWFAQYFCTAKNKGFIEGYQDGYARPERTVVLAEGLKIFLGALDEPFDVSDPDCWYCDMVDKAGDNEYLPYSFSNPTQVGPIELTRRKAFNMLYRIMIYR